MGPVEARRSMAKSAVSGEEIEPGQEATVTLAFQDGTAREVRVTADEAQRLASEGRDVSPWYVHMGRRIARPGAWVLGIAVTSLLIPAVTRQWADRPKEVELRISLVDQVAQLAASTINTARFIVADTLPEATHRAYVCTQAEESGDAAQAQRCEDLMEVEFREEQEAHIDAKTAWIQRGAILESQLIAYFPGTELSREGKRYVDAVRIYLFLASGVCGEKRAEANTKLLRYLREDPEAPQWTPLYDMSELECDQKSADLEFREVYGPLGDRMLAQRLDLLLLLNESDAEGFSTGLGDFAVDALPALILLAVAALYLLWYASLLRRRDRRPPAGVDPRRRGRVSTS
jgi:hypothetical protein